MMFFIQKKHVFLGTRVFFFCLKQVFFCVKQVGYCSGSKKRVLNLQFLVFKQETMF